MKKEIRKNILEQKNGMSSETIVEKSHQIFNILRQTSLYDQSENVMLYVSFNTEVRTKPIIDDLIMRGKNVYVPVAQPQTKELIVSQLKDFERDLAAGHFGVMEPKKENLRPTSPHILDLIIVPGVVFDMEGYRIGYGGGYYDRFLGKQNITATTIALAFEMQLVDKVPIDQYDIPVEYIITEKRLIHCWKKD